MFCQSKAARRRWGMSRVFTYRRCVGHRARRHHCSSYWPLNTTRMAVTRMVLPHVTGGEDGARGVKPPAWCSCDSHPHLHAPGMQQALLRCCCVARAKMKGRPRSTRLRAESGLGPKPTWVLQRHHLVLSCTWIDLESALMAPTYQWTNETYKIY